MGNAALHGRLRKNRGYSMLELMIVIAIILTMMGMIMGGMMVILNRLERSKTQNLIRQLELGIKDFESDWHNFPSDRNPSMLKGSQNLSFWLCNKFEEFFTNPQKPFRRTNIRAKFIPSRGPYLEEQDLVRTGVLGDSATLSYKPYSYFYFRIYDVYGTEIIFKMPGLDWSICNPNWNNNKNSYDLYSAGPDKMHSETRPSARDNNDNIGNFNL